MYQDKAVMTTSSGPQEDPALCELQSNRHAELLDAIDELRFAHLSAQLKLPQLIVCGDTSAGKSSVLEAISGVRFPDGDSLCTRFASELVLSKDDNFSFTVQINPGENRSKEEVKELRKFALGSTYSNVQEFGDVIIKAANYLDEMQKETNSHAKFFEDTLVAKIRGPGLPRVTLVDLPGLIHASANREGKNNVDTVKNIVESYMRQPNSIILAVISANNNLANQQVIDLVQNHDPGQKRTLGIVTKPDLVPSGSDSEGEAVQLVLNRAIALQYGWHVLKNRGFESRSVSINERDLEEANFFSRGKWREIPDEDRGSRMLRIKLSEILLEAVRESLPSIVSDIDSKIVRCERVAATLGQPLEDDAARRNELTKITAQMQSLVSAAMLGHYNLFGQFFFDGTEIDANPRQLRTRLRERLDKYSEDILQRGYRFQYADDEDGATDQAISFFARRNDARTCAITEYLLAADLEDSVEKHIKKCKAGEPAGTVAPVAYTSILSFQCSGWEFITQRCVERCWKIAKDFYMYALFHAAPEHIATQIAKKFVDSKFECSKVRLAEKLKELLKPYQNRDFFTLNEEDLKKRTDATDRAMQADSEIGPTRAQKVLNWEFEAYALRKPHTIANLS